MLLSNTVENSLNCANILAAKLLAVLFLEASYIMLSFME